ncbi:hypothetical protein HYW99_03660 [Candidatus Woesearchaeota archaeon]|nr:hypothetical protein [Candidatus Woesearchaeota archaeon]
MNEEEIFDIKDKIRDVEKEYGHRLISLQLAMLEGNFLFDKAKTFIEKTNVNESIRKEGFENKVNINNNELKVRFGKVGFRTKNFKTNVGTFIPKQVEMVNELSNIRFIKIDDDKTLCYIYGGGESFIDNNIKKSLVKLCAFCSGVNQDRPF